MGNIRCVGRRLRGATGHCHFSFHAARINPVVTRHAAVLSDFPKEAYSHQRMSSTSPNTVHLEHFYAIRFEGAEARRLARTIASLPAGSRITDYISLGVVAKVFPAREVHEILQATNRASIRERDLPSSP